MHVAIISFFSYILRQYASTCIAIVINIIFLYLDRESLSYTYLDFYLAFLTPINAFQRVDTACINEPFTVMLKRGVAA